MIVVDASVVYKWIVDEDNESTRKARLIRDKYLLGREKIIVPDIMLYEIANIFVYKTNLARSDLMLAWKSFLRLNISVFCPKIDFFTECLKFSQKYKISIYGASYLVLAKKQKCDFVTADRKLASRVKLLFVKVI